MKKKLKVSIFTGNRAEYGLLSPIIKKISQSNKIDENVQGINSTISDGESNIKECEININNNRSRVLLSAGIGTIIGLLSFITTFTEFLGYGTGYIFGVFKK